MTTGGKPSRHLLGSHRDFTLLWTGGALSTVGSATSLVTYPLLVLSTTGSPALVGVAMATSMTARLLAGLPGGALVDRVDKKRLMLACDALRAGTQAAIAILLVAGSSTGTAGFGAILTLIALESAFGAVFASAEPAAVRLVVPEQSLAVALARTEARGAAATMAGPPLGGLLFAVAPWLPFAVDAASYLASFALIARLRTPMPPGRPGTHDTATAFRDVLDGLRFLWRQRFLRTTMLLIAGNNLVSNAIMLLAIVLSRQHGHHALTTGLILTVAGTGGLVGALLAPTVVRLLSVRAILVLNRTLWMALIALLSLTQHPFLIAGVIGVMFALGPAGSSAVNTLQMRLTPDEMQGRGRAAAGLLSGIASPVGVAAVGFTLQVTGPVVAVLTLALWMALMAGVALISGPIRREGAVHVGAP